IHPINRSVEFKFIALAEFHGSKGNEVIPENLSVQERLASNHHFLHFICHFYLSPLENLRSSNSDRRIAIFTTHPVPSEKVFTGVSYISVLYEVKSFGRCQIACKRNKS